jgi:stage V sporulation protein AC
MDNVDSIKMTKQEYSDYVAKKAPRSTSVKDMLLSFFFGGLICCVAQGLLMAYERLGADAGTAKSAVSVTLIFLGALLTAMHKYERLAKIAKAGTLVPITGFANSVTATAIEYRSEGLITGTAARMFNIAGPVIVYGVSTSVIYGIVYYFVSK